MSRPPELAYAAVNAIKTKLPDHTPSVSAVTIS